MDFKEVFVESSYPHTLRIPKEWVFTELSEAINVIGGSQPPKSEFSSEPKEGFVRLIQIRDYKSDQHKVFIPKDKARRFVKPDDVMIGRYGPPIFQILKGLEGAYNVALMKAEPVAGVMDNQYLYFYLQNRDIYNYVEAASDRTAGQSGVNKEHLEKYPVGLPPLAEQKVIAHKLDTLLAQVDNTKARLERIPEILKSFRQSVLTAAVSGKLSEEWRGSNKYEIQGNKLLPVGWKAEPASMVCLKVQSGSTPRDNPFDQNGTIPFLKVYNIVNQKINFDYKPQFVTADVHKSSLKRSIAQPNDVLMNIVGPPLGKVAVLTDQYPEWNLNQAITLFRADSSTLHHLFLYHVLCEGELVREVMPDTKGSVGQVNISLSQCRDALLPIPPLEEQNEIVRRVEELFAYADRIEQAAQAAQSRVNNLTQSILAKAFRGELTADWRTANPELITGDNSAEVLLTKIKTERAKLHPIKKARSKSVEN